MVTWPSGKAKVCKTFIHQFKSGRHLHKTVMKKISQSFFFAVSSKICSFTTQFWDAVLQCCPTILGRFPQLDAHFPCRFLEFGRGGGNFFEKKQNKSCYFQNVFNFPVVGSLPTAGIFGFSRQFSVCFQVFHFITYGQAAGNHVGNERGGSFNPPGSDYHRHYQRGRQSNHNRDNRNCPRNRTDPQSTR